MELHFDSEEMRDLIRQVVADVLSAIDWPEGRLALDEAEAARACGVGRHVLRDLRLDGKIQTRRLGKNIIYTRTDLLRALGVATVESRAADGAKRRDSCDVRESRLKAPRPEC